jgi:hypothetical protein
LLRGGERWGRTLARELRMGVPIRGQKSAHIFSRKFI